MTTILSREQHTLHVLKYKGVILGIIGNCPCTEVLLFCLFALALTCIKLVYLLRYVLKYMYMYMNNLRGDKSLIIAMKSMDAADITAQHDNLFKVWFCVFPKSIFKLRSSVEKRN